MRKNFNRREFLKTSIKGLSVLTVLGSPLKLFANPVSSTTSTSSNVDLESMYLQAKEYYLKKEYSKAADLYKQLIAAKPKLIAYYDGYAKVFNAQQDLLSTAELYRQGLKQYPQNVHFKQRFSLCLRNLCTGNRKEEQRFVNKYGEDNLMKLSASLLIEAVDVNKPIQGYLMELKDFPVALEKLNKSLKYNNTLITIDDSILNKINTLTNSIETKWEESRKSQKPPISNVDMTSDEDDGMTELIIKKSAEDKKDKKDKKAKKAVKERWRNKLKENIASDKANNVEKIATLLLSDDVRDTDTVGKLRRYYKKQKNGKNLINLNRNLYESDNTYTNALALASSLVKYSSSKKDTTEAQILLTQVQPYVNTLPLVVISSYYMSSFQVNMGNKDYSTARDTLLEGLKLLDGRGGLSYSFIENYAVSYLKEESATGVIIMNSICKNELSDDTDEKIKPYIKKYLKSIEDKTLSIPEQLKRYNALAKLQKKAGDANYSTTLAKVQSLKTELKNSQQFS